MRSKNSDSKHIINWDETHNLFNDELHNIVKEISDNNYDNEVDDEDVIKEGIKKDYLDDVFKRIHKFKAESYELILKEECDTIRRYEDILLKEWIDITGKSRIQLLTFVDRRKSDYGYDNYIPVIDPEEQGYALIYGDYTTYLIIGCFYESHFVYHPSFTFDSNYDVNKIKSNTCIIDDIAQIRRFFRIKTNEILFEPVYIPKFYTRPI